MHRNFDEVRTVIPEIRWQTDRQTDTQTDISLHATPIKQAASLTERNNRLAQSRNCFCGRILLKYLATAGATSKVYNARRLRFPTKVTKFRAYPA